MPQLRIIGKLHTKIHIDDGFTCVKYHNTDVVRFNNNEIVLNSDGWNTQTTKNRMNQTSNQFNLRYRIFQQKGIWQVNFKGTDINFHDGMTLIR
jgi:hypothetical protein